MSVVGFVFSVCWFDNYTAPPEGQPRVKAEIFIPTEPGQGAPRTPEELQKLLTLGDGYCISVSALSTPTKVWSPERKIKNRNRLLRSRMEKKFPLFAEQFIEEEVKRKPKYYLEGKGDYDDERAEILGYYARRFEFFVSNPGKLILGGWECQQEQKS